MYRIVKAQPLDGFRVEITFADGAHGVVDLSHLAGRGVFASWTDPAQFAQVSIGEGGELVWPGPIDLCADALYLKVTGKSAVEAFADLRREPAHA